jgi:hypothetical protein
MSDNPVDNDQPNPYRSPLGNWWWYDVNAKIHGPYTTEAFALEDLLIYVVKVQAWRDMQVKRREKK